MLRVSIFSLSLVLIFTHVLCGNSPSLLENKKLSVSFSIPAKSSTGTHEFYILNGVDVAGYYWKTSNDTADVPDWSSERYNYRKTGNSTGSLTIINSSGEPTLLELSFTSSTTASCNLSFWSMTNGELVKESYTGTATVSLTDLVLSDIPIEYQVAEPSGYFAPASISAGILSAQDKYWSLYDETISFLSTGAFSASITNDDTGSPLSASGTSYTYTKTGTNSATLSYSIDGAGISFEYALQFTGENTGIYSKFADYGGGSTDITTGPFSLSGIAVPEQYAWEDYDDFSGSNLDSSKWEVTWFKGGRGPTIVNGALQLGGSGDPNDPASDSMPYALSLLTLPENGSTHPFAIITDSSVYGLEAEIMLPIGSQYSTGLNFLCYDTTSQEADGSWKQFGPEIEYWSGQNPALEYQYLDPSTGQIIEESIPVNFDTYYKASLIQDGNKSMIFLDGEKVADFHYPEFAPNAFGFFAFNDDGYPFETYVKNVRVLRRSQETTDPEPDPVTVVSDQNGNPVVVQVGDEYQWSSNLDGVTIWALGVEGEELSKMGTAKFENGNKLIVFDIVDEVNGNETYNHPYIVDENGYIRVTESVYQYYNVVGVEDGAIRIIQDSNGLESVADDGINQVSMLYFTTRAAAEEYYYSKANPKNWMWFDHYPWVYSEEEGDWLYFYPSGGILRYWSNKGQAWRKFNN